MYKIGMALCINLHRWTVIGKQNTMPRCPHCGCLGYWSGALTECSNMGCMLMLKELGVDIENDLFRD